MLPVRSTDRTSRRPVSPRAWISRMDNFVPWIGAGFGSYLVIELLLGRFWPANGTPRENLLDVLAAGQAWVLVGPLVVLFTAAIERAVLPGHADSLINTPKWLQLIAFLVFDDLVQYSWHRASHYFPWLWGMHKFHHSPPFMGVRIVWRN